jgi:hypothetical protein
MIIPLRESAESARLKTSVRKIRLFESRLVQTGRVSNFPACFSGEPADSRGCPFLGTSFGQAKEVHNHNLQTRYLLSRDFDYISMMMQ